MDQTHDLIKPGDHLVVLYEHEAEVAVTVTSFLLAALNRNDRCIYITGESNTQYIKDQLALVCDYDDYVDKKQLLFLDKEDTYSVDGNFVPDKMVQTLNEIAEEAIQDGYNGLAVTGEISWVLHIDSGFQKIIEYEWKLNEFVFNNSKVSALCRYNMNRFTDEMIVNIIELHPFIVLANRIYENPFFIPSEGYKSDNIKKYQVTEMLKNIVEYENTKSEFNKLMRQKEKELIDLEFKMSSEMVQSMISLLELHDVYTKYHSNSVADLALIISTKLKLSKIECTKNYYAALVHDIGKIIIPKEILHKEDTLTSEEMEIIRDHPVTAYKTLNKTKSLGKVAEIVKHHHERFDGTGYPDNIKENDIPLGARIISVVDAYDAMTNDRPYRGALTKEEAIKELIDNKGTQFDPEIVDLFVDELSTEAKVS